MGSGGETKLLRCILYMHIKHIHESSCEKGTIRRNVNMKKDKLLTAKKERFILEDKAGEKSPPLFILIN